MAGLVKGILGVVGLGGGGSKECETAKRALELHDGQITVAIDSENMMVVMQVDEKKNAQPILFDLLNNVIQNVTVVPPANQHSPSDVPVSAWDVRRLQEQIDDLRMQLNLILEKQEEENEGTN
jgi:hypothetical protein